MVAEKSKKHINGWVVTKYENSTIYIGEMRGNKRHGFGYRTYRNSDIIYIGQYYKNKKHGKGKIFRISDDFKIYDGDWQYEEKHGHGVLVGKEANYEGQFFKDHMQGKGKMHWLNGDFYEG